MAPGKCCTPLFASWRQRLLSQPDCFQDMGSTRDTVLGRPYFFVTGERQGMRHKSQQPRSYYKGYGTHEQVQEIATLARELEKFVVASVTLRF